MCSLCSPDAADAAPQPQALYDSFVLLMRTEIQRYRSAVERNLAELNNAILKRRALIGANDADSAHGLDFFRLACHALYNDMWSHTFRVFDTHTDSASFWYVVRVKPAVAEEAARAIGVSIREIEKKSESLKSIRDKTHFHIDKKAVENPAAIWREAGVTGDELGILIETAWNILQEIYSREFGVEKTLPSYDGSDVGRIIRSYAKEYPDVGIVI